MAEQSEAWTGATEPAGTPAPADPRYPAAGQADPRHRADATAGPRRPAAADAEHLHEPVGQVEPSASADRAGPVFGPDDRVDLLLGPGDPDSSGPFELGSGHRAEGQGSTPAVPRWAALAVAAAAVIGAVVIAVGYGPGAYQMFRQKDATLSAPAQVAGLNRDDSQQAADAADYLRTALAADLGLRNPLGAVYVDPAASSQSVILAGGTGLFRTPARDLSRAFELLDDASSQVAGIRDVSAGELGGIMRCGTMSGPGEAIAVCGWADHGAVAIAMFPGRSAAAAASLMRELRIAVQHRN